MELLHATHAGGGNEQATSALWDTLVKATTGASAQHAIVGTSWNCGAEEEKAYIARVAGLGLPGRIGSLLLLLQLGHLIVMYL